MGAEVSALGKTAIIAHSGALPEVVSGDIRFFATEDTEQLQHALHAVYHDMKETPYQTFYQRIGNIAQIQALYDNILHPSS
ncbi:MAG: hypothetical protein H6766_07100 [Candidatus Peribacteria bacterium]|nr:MAG: hypothetical protein H6766_07100 [Candidatus Peribacteria bacterium]